MDKEKENCIKVCMGSSCFARGNSENLKIIENFIANNNLNIKIELFGNRCENKCSSGPNIVLNGKMVSRVETSTLLNLLTETYVEHSKA